MEVGERTDYSTESSEEQIKKGKKKKRHICSGCDRETSKAHGDNWKLGLLKQRHLLLRVRNQRASPGEAAGWGGHPRVGRDRQAPACDLS